MRLKLLFIGLVCTSFYYSKANDGYKLWLDYAPLTDSVLLKEYINFCTTISIYGTTETDRAIKDELQLALSAMLSLNLNFDNTNADLIIGTPENSPIISTAEKTLDFEKLGIEGYIIKTINNESVKKIIIAANTEIGTLYGTYHFLRLLQTHQELTDLNIVEIPKTTHRLLNHWDNLDRTVERGYAGFSIWDWHKLPDYISQQYIDYARANASIGINGAVITNVNANALVLTHEYLLKLNGLAKVFRPYGIKVYLTARFSAPVEIGGLKTADPLDKEVIQWWNQKIEEIYSIIPDFGGFLVKANSEGQPGPQNYNRNHADGANMLAKALTPHQGIVMWRAFVYDNNVPDDRAKQAYNEFKPLDGLFDSNVFVQVKNGAIDFQPREPFHPLFGAMEKTPEMMEFQITQEYLGCATHLVYLAPLYKETLDADTYAKGKGSTVAKIIDGTLFNHQISGMAGVSNIGTDRNWTGHPFAQANWYAFGRLAWNHGLSSGEIAEEWLRMTFTNAPAFVNTVKSMMLQSREVAVNYMTPLGLHHQMAWNHHWGPGPWVNIGRADWTSPYYNKAGTDGLGFDRSGSGSNAVSQYFEPVRSRFNNLNSCPEKYLLWFHHVSWDYKLSSGLNLWEELCQKYYSGAQQVANMQQTWEQMEGYIDHERFIQVKQLLQIQANEAIWWRNAMLLYFQTFSKKAIPGEYEQPNHTLEYYESLKFNYVPGIKSE